MILFFILQPAYNACRWNWTIYNTLIIDILKNFEEFRGYRDFILEEDGLKVYPTCIWIDWQVWRPLSIR